MKAVACVALAIIGVFATQPKEQPVWKKEFTLDEFSQMNTVYVFKEWAKSFGRHYQTIEDETLRYKIWYENLGRISSTNTKNLSYKLRFEPIC